MLKLAISCGGATYAIQDFDETTIYAQEAEKIGIDTIWTAEASWLPEERREQCRDIAHRRSSGSHDGLPRER